MAAPTLKLSLLNVVLGHAADAARRLTRELVKGHKRRFYRGASQPKLKI